MAPHQYRLTFAQQASTDLSTATAGHGGCDAHCTLDPIGPRPASHHRPATVRFVAGGGLLEAHRIEWHRELPRLEYPKPPPFMRSHPGFGDPDESPDEHRISGLVEHAAEMLFAALREADELDRVANRFERSGAGGPACLSPHRLEVVDALRAEIAEVNRFYSECLEDYRSLMGDAAANQLDEWLSRVWAEAG